MSQLRAGKLERFSIDRLVRFALNAQLDVALTVQTDLGRRGKDRPPPPVDGPAFPAPFEA